MDSFNNTIDTQLAGSTCNIITILADINKKQKEIQDALLGTNNILNELNNVKTQLNNLEEQVNNLPTEIPEPDLSNLVTLNTEQTITATKTFNAINVTSINIVTGGGE